MKSMIQLFTLLLTLHLLVDAQEAFANVYASQLKATNPDGTPFDGDFNDGTGAALSFILNDNASSVTIAIKELASGTVVHEIDLGALNRGSHSAVWDGTGAEPGQQYAFEVTAEQPNYSNTEWTVFFDSGDIDIFSRGCDIVRDMSSPLFGLIYTPNNGGPLGKGIAIYNPDGSFHDPFIVTPDINDGGTIDWGGGDPMVGGIFDEELRFYVSSIPFGEVRRLNTDNTITAVLTGLTNPKGLSLVGTGADRVLYICDDNQVVRAAIGNDEVFTGTVEVVGDFANALPRNVALDDDGYMYVSFRVSNDLASDPMGMNKYDISAALPVTDDDATWFLSAGVTYRIAEIEIDHGGDRSTSTDDILYYSTRAGDGNTDDGVWRVEDINFPFPQVIALVDEMDLYGFDDSANINDRAAIGLDAAGNIILMENSNEHVFFLTPPGEGATNSFATTSPDTITVGSMVSVEGPAESMPSSFRLEQNYPNPFNPSTTIRYDLTEPGFTLVKIFNSLGEEVRTLVAENQSVGQYQFVWDGKDNQGKSLGSGVYILTLTSGEFKQSMRMTLMK